MFTRATRTAAALAGLFLIAAAALPGAARAQTVEWRGFAYLHSFTAPCEANGWSGTPQMGVRFRPSGLGTNGDSSRLAFFDRFYAMGFYLDDSRFDRTWRTVDGGSIGSSVWNWQGTPQIRVTTQTPNNTNLRATTPTVRLVGQVRNFEEIAGCTVSFDATLLLRR